MEKLPILIVEDTEFLGSLVKETLERNGFVATWAKSLAQAEEALAGPQKFFAAILDYSLPDANDGEIIEAVLVHRVPSIVFTGHMSTAVRDRIWESNVVDYFLKNDKSSLQNIVDQLNRLKRNMNTKVLVVDDSAFYRKIVSELLKVQLYDVQTAPDGNVALEILERDGEQIKLLITDYNMPDMDGVKLVQETRKIFSSDQMVIIGISSEGENMMAVEFLKNGANDFIIKKQFLAEEFYSRINQCLDNMENIQHIQDINEQKNKFLGMAAHDLRNPLGSIRGFAEILSDGDMDKEMHIELSQLIQKTSNEMLETLNNLLDVSQIESGKFNIDLKEAYLPYLIQDRIKLANISAEKKGMKIIAELNDIAPVKIDSGKIGQVIDNFISNAIKYSPLDTEITCSLKYEDGVIKFGVKDQGPGIAEEEQHKLFGEFARLSTRATGGEKSTGLGLAISKKIIKAHGGKIGVQSTVGDGAEFYFELTT